MQSQGKSFDDAYGACLGTLLVYFSTSCSYPVIGYRQLSKILVVDLTFQMRNNRRDSHAALQVCCWICAAMSFLPRAAIRRLFPPMVPGVVIFLVNIPLPGSVSNGERPWTEAN